MIDPSDHPVRGDATAIAELYTKLDEMSTHRLSAYARTLGIIPPDDRPDWSVVLRYGPDGEELACSGLTPTTTTAILTASLNRPGSDRGDRTPDGSSQPVAESPVRLLDRPSIKERIVGVHATSSSWAARYTPRRRNAAGACTTASTRAARVLTETRTGAMTATRPRMAHLDRPARQGAR